MNVFINTQQKCGYQDIYRDYAKGVAESAINDLKTKNSETFNNKYFEVNLDIITYNMRRMDYHVLT